MRLARERKIANGRGLGKPRPRVLGPDRIVEFPAFPGKPSLPERGRLALNPVFAAERFGGGRQMIDDQLSNVWAPRLLAALRIISALLFLEHGLVKVFGFPAGAAPGQQALLSFFGIAGLIETVGGVLLLIGLLTRPVAFLLAGEMAVGYFMVHAPMSVFPAVNGGDAAILFCFVFLYLCVAGPGAWSIDEMRKRG
jgi:putative oxidoreductase